MTFEKGYFEFRSYVKKGNRESLCEAYKQFTLIKQQYRADKNSFEYKVALLAECYIMHHFGSYFARNSHFKMFFGVDYQSDKNFRDNAIIGFDSLKSNGLSDNILSDFATMLNEFFVIENYTLPENKPPQKEFLPVLDSKNIWGFAPELEIKKEPMQNCEILGDMGNNSEE